MNNRRGRPKTGTSNARDRVLTAARDLFLECGYDGATLRMIAAQAECDVALIAYHFGSKKQLFAHAMALELGPAEVLEDAFSGEPSDAPARIAERVIRAWEDPELQLSLVRFFQACLQDPELLRAFREYVETEVLGRLVEYLGNTGAARERATALMTILVGIGFGKYVIGVEPMRSMSPERLLRTLRPSLRAISEQARER